MEVYVIWYRDHVHTNIFGGLKVFRSRKEALKWKREQGTRECKIRRAKLRVEPS